MKITPLPFAYGIAWETCLHWLGAFLLLSRCMGSMGEWVAASPTRIMEKNAEGNLHALARSDLTPEYEWIRNTRACTCTLVACPDMVNSKHGTCRSLYTSKFIIRSKEWRRLSLTYKKSWCLRHCSYCRCEQIWSARQLGFCLNPQNLWLWCWPLNLWEIQGWKLSISSVIHLTEVGPLQIPWPTFSQDCTWNRRMKGTLSSSSSNKARAAPPGAWSRVYYYTNARKYYAGTCACTSTVTAVMLMAPGTLFWDRASKKSVARLIMQLTIDSASYDHCHKHVL